MVFVHLPHLGSELWFGLLHFSDQGSPLTRHLSLAFVGPWNRLAGRRQIGCGVERSVGEHTVSAAIALLLTSIAHPALLVHLAVGRLGRLVGRSGGVDDVAQVRWLYTWSRCSRPQNLGRGGHEPRARCRFHCVGARYLGVLYSHRVRTGQREYLSSSLTSYLSAQHQSIQWRSNGQLSFKFDDDGLLVVRSFLVQLSRRSRKIDDPDHRVSVFRARALVCELTKADETIIATDSTKIRMPVRLRPESLP